MLSLCTSKAVARHLSSLRLSQEIGFGHSSQRRGATQCVSNYEISQPWLAGRLVDHRKVASSTLARCTWTSEILLGLRYPLISPPSSAVAPRHPRCTLRLTATPGTPGETHLRASVQTFSHTFERSVACGLLRLSCNGNFDSIGGPSYRLLVA